LRLVRSDEAAGLLREGAVVAVPTDTVYGLAASIAFPDAVARLFSIKRRPATSALPVLIDGLDVAERLGVAWPEVARRLSEAFWPGALTIVVPAPHELASVVNSAADTVGFRVPDDALLLEVLVSCGPLAVSSANDHGGPPCHNANDVIGTFAGRDGLDGVLDGGERSGRVSTVVAIEESGWRVLRDGSVTMESLARALR